MLCTCMNLMKKEEYIFALPNAIPAKRWTARNWKQQNERIQVRKKSVDRNRGKNTRSHDEIVYVFSYLIKERRWWFTLSTQGLHSNSVYDSIPHLNDFISGQKYY